MTGAFDEHGGTSASSRIDALKRRVAAGPDSCVPSMAGGGSDHDRRADFAAWWLRAARLAMLGDAGPFESWPRIAASLEVDVSLALREAAREGVASLDDAMGEPLAEAIIDAEDASCLLEAERRVTRLVPALGAVIEAWVAAAERTVLDEDARAIVVEHRDAWPIPDAVRPAVVATPLSEIDFGVAAARWSSSSPTRLAAVFEFEALAAQFHQDGLAPESMRTRFAARRGEAVTRGDAMLQVNPRLDAYWGVFVEIVGDAATRVRSVRLGDWPLQPVPDAGDGTSSSGPDDGPPMRLFELTLAGQPLDVRLQLVSSDIGVTTLDGERFLL